MWNFKLFQFSEFSNEFFNISLPCLSKATLRKIMCQWPPFLRLRACIPVTWPRRLLRRQLKKSQIMTPSVKLSVRQSGRNQSILFKLFIYLEAMKLKCHVKSGLIRGFLWHFSARGAEVTWVKTRGWLSTFSYILSIQVESNSFSKDYLFIWQSCAYVLIWLHRLFLILKKEKLTVTLEFELKSSQDLGR